jgi:putative transcriptional regulator
MIIKLEVDEMLEKRGRSAYWLSQQTGIAQTSLVRIRKQRTAGIQWDTLLKLCIALECTPCDLIVMSEEKQETKKKTTKKS